MPERLYHYYFLGIDVPVTVNAPNNQTARTILAQILPFLQKYAYRQVIGETTSSLVTGASTMVKSGKTFVWDGQRWKEKILNNAVQRNRNFLWTATGWKEIK